mgnify:CR=1 FL=1
MIRILILFILFSNLKLTSQSLGLVTIYNTSNSSIISNEINCLEFDNQNNLWIGTPSGLNILEEDGSWSYFNIDSVTNTENNNITCLEYTTTLTPKMYIGTNSGIISSSINLWEVNKGWECHPNNGTINAISCDSGLWVGTTEGLCFETIETKSGWGLDNIKSGFYSNNITSIKHNNSTNKTVIGTMNGGLVIYDETGFDVYYSSNSGILDNTIWDLAFDENNNLILCTPQAGMGILTNNGSWIWLNTINSTIASNSLKKVVVDNNNSIWISSLESGLIEYTNNSFYTYNTENSELPDNTIKSLLVGPNNNLWIGTQSNGLIKATINNNIANDLQKTIASHATVFDSYISLKGVMSKAVLIFNQQGQLVKISLNHNSDSIKINTANFKPGLYFAHILGESKVQKLIKY